MASSKSVSFPIDHKAVLRARRGPEVVEDDADSDVDPAEDAAAKDLAMYEWE